MKHNLTDKDWVKDLSNEQIDLVLRIAKSQGIAISEQLRRLTRPNQCITFTATSNSLANAGRTTDSISLYAFIKKMLPQLPNKWAIEINKGYPEIQGFFRLVFNDSKWAYPIVWYDGEGSFQGADAGMSPPGECFPITPEAFLELITEKSVVEKPVTVDANFVRRAYEAMTPSQRYFVNGHIDPFTGVTTEEFIRTCYNKIACADWKEKMLQEFPFLQVKDSNPITRDNFRNGIEHLANFARETWGMTTSPLAVINSSCPADKPELQGRAILIKTALAGDPCLERLPDGNVMLYFIKETA
jgi:hypothetical protein